MPSSKSSTSSETKLKQRELIQYCVDNGKFQELLDELLDTIHRDSGQYRTLVGYTVAIEDALEKVVSMRRKLSSLLFKAPKR